MNEFRDWIDSNEMVMYLLLVHNIHGQMVEKKDYRGSLGSYWSDCPICVLNQKLKEIKVRIKRWNKSVFGNVHEKVAMALKAVKHVQSEIDNACDNAERDRNTKFFNRKAPSGVRPGNPSSPLLFCLVEKALNRSVAEELDLSWCALFVQENRDLNTLRQLLTKLAKWKGSLKYQAKKKR
ncbi:unnamed protein product [Sphenostylis stenocarpa]|uniref:Uncharacterized protein n=1 Tax=Sphenostylis stenocarpa TaxID=92480 RepID=A0AA86V9B2_9FABA|nr:unnamed protein product [Sphenostylis stenocarpa]